MSCPDVTSKCSTDTGPVATTSLSPDKRAHIYQQTASLYQPPTWEQVSGILERLVMKYPGFLASGNIKVKIAKELDLLEKESYRYSLETFQAEYVRLFINDPAGVAAPPYASFYTENRLLGSAAREALSFYEGQGLTREATEADPPDHIITELEFLSFLCTMEQQARDRNRRDEAIELSRTQALFFFRHLFPWASRFCTRLHESSRLAYYQVLGVFTKGFLLNERRILGKDIPSGG